MAWVCARIVPRRRDCQVLRLCLRQKQVLHLASLYGGGFPLGDQHGQYMEPGDTAWESIDSNLRMGGIKPPLRGIQKADTEFSGDPSRILDVCRCSPIPQHRFDLPFPFPLPFPLPFPFPFHLPFPFPFPFPFHLPFPFPFPFSFLFTFALMPPPRSSALLPRIVQGLGSSALLARVPSHRHSNLSTFPRRFNPRRLTLYRQTAGKLLFFRMLMTCGLASML